MRTKLLVLLLLTFLLVSLAYGFRRYRYRYRNYHRNYRFSRRYNRYNINKQRSYNCQPAEPTPQNNCTKITCEKKIGQLNVYLKNEKKDGCLYKGKCYKERMTIVPDTAGCNIVYCFSTTYTTRAYKSSSFCQYEGKCYPRGKQFPGKNEKMCRCMYNGNKKVVLPVCR